MKTWTLMLLLVGWVPAAFCSTPDLANKEATARAVFDRLVAARGDANRPTPYFALTSARRSGARCEGRLIVLEEAAFDLCTSFGPESEAALATVLAHELIHYYARHGQSQDTIGLVGNPGSNADEAEADYQGGFLAYLAGYPVVNVMPRILEGLYALYDLPERVGDYPTLTERTAMANQTYQETRRLMDVFDMATALTALDRYAEAAPYFEYLQDAFPSREMYNNAGVVYARAALPMFQTATLKFVYPIELDLDSRLSGQTRSVTVDRETREFYLNTARGHFERARLLDPEYAPALLNLASTHALLAASLLEGEPDSLKREIAADRRLEAGLRAREVARLGNDAATSANSYVLLGILAAIESDTTKAIALLEAAGDTPLAIVNRHILSTGEKPQQFKNRKGAGYVITETLANRSMADLYLDAAPDGPDQVIAKGAYPIRLTRLLPPDDQITLLRHSAEDGQIVLVLARTKIGYRGTTALEITRGDQRTKVVKEYGSPAYSITTVGGELIAYPESQLVFSIRDGLVQSWFLYEAN